MYVTKDFARPMGGVANMRQRLVLVCIAFFSGLVVLSCVPANPGDGSDGGDDPAIGSVSGNGQVQIEVSGLIATLTAVADDGWRFVRWEGPNDVSRANPHNVGAAFVGQYQVVFLPDGVSENDNDNTNDNGDMDTNGPDDMDTNGPDDMDTNGPDDMDTNGPDDMDTNGDDSDPPIMVGIGTIPSRDTVGRFGHAVSAMQDGILVVTGGVTTTNGESDELVLMSVSEFSFFRPLSRSFADFFRPTVNDESVLNFDLLTPRSFHTQSTLPDNRILIAGGDAGANQQSTGTPTATAEIFDPALGTVESAPDMNRARSRHTATVLSDGRVLVVGGDDWQIFDASTDQWSDPIATEFSRTSHAAALLADFDGSSGEDRVLIVGGDAQTNATIELLDPQANESVTLASTLPLGLSRLAAITLPSGEVLVVGGVDQASGDTVASAFLIDPVGDQVTPIDDPPNRADGIADHQMVLIEDRFVFLAGGEQIVGGQREILRYLAIYDSQTGEWVDSGETRNPHDDFIMALLDIGEVVISGSGQATESETPIGITEIAEFVIAGNEGG